MCSIARTKVLRQSGTVPVLQAGMLPLSSNSGSGRRAGKRQCLCNSVPAAATSNCDRQGRRWWIQGSPCLLCWALCISTSKITAGCMPFADMQDWEQLERRLRGLGAEGPPCPPAAAASPGARQSWVVIPAVH